MDNSYYKAEDLKNSETLQNSRNSLVLSFSNIMVKFLKKVRSLNERKP